MCLFAIGIEDPLDMSIERLHDTDPRQHRIAAAAAQHQHFDCRLPFRQIGFLPGKLRNVVGRVLQREQLPAVGQNDGIFETDRPGQKTYSGNEPIPSGLPTRSCFVLFSVL